MINFYGAAQRRLFIHNRKKILFWHIYAIALPLHSGCEFSFCVFMHAKLSNDEKKQIKNGRALKRFTEYIRLCYTFRMP